MKQTNQKIFIIGAVVVSTCALIVAVILYFGFFGTPWGKTQAEHKFTAYCENKFPFKVVLEKIDFDFGVYTARFCAKTPEQCSFRVFEISADGIVDDYFSSLWEQQITQQIASYRIPINAQLEPVIDFDYDLYRSYGLTGKPTSYQSVKNNIKQYVEITIKFNDYYRTDELTQIAVNKILAHLAERGIVFNELNFFYPQMNAYFTWNETSGLERNE